MPGYSVDGDLALRLDALRGEHGDTVKVDGVAELVRELLATLTGELSAADLRLYHELESLASYIHDARAEIASLKAQDLSSEYIASATDELDAIVGATEKATNTILDAAERMDEVLGEAPPEVAQKLTEVTTAIYEACNFQDITGQRITKVVKALKHIEAKVEALVAAFAPDGAKSDAPPPRSEPQPDGKPSDEDLLNGPQLPDKAAKQAEIDALFASFD